MKKQASSLFDEYNDALIKLALNDSVNSEGERLLADADTSELQPSPDERERMIALVKRERSYFRTQTKTRKYLSRAAMLFIALIAAFSVTYVSVDAFRERVHSVIFNTGNENFLYIVGSDDDNDKLLATYEGKYRPPYCPDGYYVEEVTNGNSIHSVTFNSNTGKTMYCQELSSSARARMKIDTEDADEIKEITISGFKGYKVVKDDRTTVVWYTDDCILLLVSNDSDFDLVGYAQSFEAC